MLPPSESTFILLNCIVHEKKNLAFETEKQEIRVFMYLSLLPMKFSSEQYLFVTLLGNDYPDY